MATHTREAQGGGWRMLNQRGAYNTPYRLALEQCMLDCEKIIGGCCTCPELKTCEAWHSSLSRLTCIIDGDNFPLHLNQFLHIRERAITAVNLQVRHNREVYYENLSRKPQANPAPSSANPR